MKSKISCWRFVRSLPMSIAGASSVSCWRVVRTCVRHSSAPRGRTQGGRWPGWTRRLGTFIGVERGALIGGCGADPPPKPQKPVQLTVSAPVRHRGRPERHGPGQRHGEPGGRGRASGSRGTLARVSGGTFTFDGGRSPKARTSSTSPPPPAAAPPHSPPSASRARNAWPCRSSSGCRSTTRAPRRASASSSSPPSAAAASSTRWSRAASTSAIRRPALGKQVRRGTTVKLLVARSC